MYLQWHWQNLRTLADRTCLRLEEYHLWSCPKLLASTRKVLVAVKILQGFRSILLFRHEIGQVFDITHSWLVGRGTFQSPQVPRP